MSHTTKESHPKLQNIDANTTKEDLIEIYKTWCKTYDEDTLQNLTYLAPSLGAKHLSAKLNEFGFGLDASILDLGVGTGLVGETLSQLGHINVDGLDISPEMIEVATQKGVYRKLFIGYMASENSHKLGVEANSYDAAISIGVFTIGHVKGEGFDDLVHAVKPGGLVCFTIRDCIANDPSYGYSTKIEQLCNEKKWKLVFKVHELYHGVNEFCSWLYVYQIL